MIDFGVSFGTGSKRSTTVGNQIKNALDLRESDALERMLESVVQSVVENVSGFPVKISLG